MSDDRTPGALPPEPPAPRAAVAKGGWTRAILIVSLVLNLVLLGAIAGAGLSHRMEPGRRAAPDAGLGLLYDALPRDDQRALRRAVIAELRSGGRIRGDIAADTRALLDALRAEPFDRAALERVLARQRDRATGFLETGSQRILDRLDSMTAAERALYAEALEDRIRRRPAERD